MDKYNYIEKFNTDDFSRKSGIYTYYMNNEIADLEFHILKDVVIIEDIQIYSVFYNKYKHNHIGTSMFNKMLKCLDAYNVNFHYIKGRLSPADAENKNWVKSIPFYLHCHKYFNELSYKLFTTICDKNTNQTLFTSDDNPVINLMSCHRFTL